MARSGQDGEMPFMTVPTPIRVVTPVSTWRRIFTGVRRLPTTTESPL
ncbi:hypothetical protein FB476_1581 [Ornithinimicrobium humiphilum]|uniref:Uncharacterized protein n=1 Tax=Ornithinimicrobium humiphilum TaxID=125288 RepID=A0A543KNP9_9MICO|nr:hypothetical protein FB476_1581 [Ornithinimicrobium humiphilum]